MSGRTATLAVALGLWGAGLGACDAKDGGFARAYQATSPDQLIGGDVAMARVGDFILENDKVRIAILNKDSSPAPGVFGGTFVDADLVRPDAKFRGGNGHDQLAEVIPVVNLLWPRPGEMDVTIEADGADGGAAIVRVVGEGGIFLEALSLLRGDLVGALFRGAKFDLRLETDYILEPGKSYVRIVGRIVDNAAEDNPTVAPLDPIDGAVPILGAILGDAASETAPGVMAGDFVFFGAKNDIFAPGIGFDEERPVFDALFRGDDTFTSPLVFDFMAASGGAVSYGYFSAAEGADPKVLVPIITSSSTAFVTHTKNCSTGRDDDETCDALSQWSYERYFAIGRGDIASIADIIHEVRGTPVGTVRGVVLGDNGQPLPNARVFLFRDPDPTRTWESIDAAVAENYRQIDGPGLLNAIEADVGLDPVEDGGFRATNPPGRYLIVAQNEAQTSTSAVTRIELQAGEDVVVAPVVPAPARVRYRVTDGAGQRIAAKLSFVSRDGTGALAEGDGLRRPYMGEGRLGNGVRYMIQSVSGEGVAEVEAGSYRLFASHGPEYSLATADLDLAPGQEVVLPLVVRREVDTSGWISGDFHLHAEASFDSGMSFERRVTSALVEGLDLAVSTDHDIVADYSPAVAALGVEDRIKTGVGVEMSTLELGHFVGFPLTFDASIIPHHGAPDWTCLDGPLLMEELGSKIAPGEVGVRILAHPRDGFIGHISQLGLDPYDLSRELDFLEANNVLLARTTCDFEAMELFNGKRFDLVRTPTNAEVVIFNRCMGRIDDATDSGQLDVACPELTDGGPLASCPEGERHFDCQQRHRRRLAYLSSRDILIRTPEEQVAGWTFAPGESSARHCDPDRDADANATLAVLPCVHHVGTYDEWMRWLDRGLAVTITGSSDSHGSAREPGFPRTYVEHPADTPASIDVGAVAEAIGQGRAMPTFGPFVEAHVGAASAGDIAAVSGATFDLDLRVQTASWFGVDRIEVYVSGLLEEVVELTHGPETIIDFDGVVTLPVPDRDGFVSVIALGTREDNLLRPVSFDIQFGELQLPRVAGLAFAAIPGFSLVFSPSPPVPDFFPVFPMAATNAIFLDVDGDGAWTPSDEPPPLCRQACDPAAADPGCPEGLSCLATGECGLPVEGECVTGPPGSESLVPTLLE